MKIKEGDAPNQWIEKIQAFQNQTGAVAIIIFMGNKVNKIAAKTEKKSLYD